MKNTIIHTVYAVALTLVLPGTLMAAESHPNQTRKEAVQLTDSVERTSRHIRKEVDHLISMRKNVQISNYSHQAALQRIANHVNEDLQPALTRLAELQPELPLWQQNAIAQLRTSAATLAANANAAVDNRNPSEMRRAAFVDADYGSLLENIHGQAADLVEVADATGDYGRAQLKGRDAGLAVHLHD